MVVLELYYKTAGELAGTLLHDVILQLHSRVGLSRVLLTFKGQSCATQNVKDVTVLRSVLPEQVSVSCVWSSKIASVGTGKHARGSFTTKEDANIARFKEYVSGIETAGSASVLVVSGTGKKAPLDSVAILQRVVPEMSNKVLYGCAFNPHIGGVLDPSGGEREREDEWRRLLLKLDTGSISELWITFGADVAALKASLTRLKEELDRRKSDNRLKHNVHLYGSVFVPSKAWIAKMRFRCWAGTYLGGKDDADGYLSGADTALAITQQVLSLYQSFGVEPVIESAVRTPKQAEEAALLLLGTGNHAPKGCLP